MDSRLRPVVVAVCGSPAAGKTTIARAVADRCRLALITRDELAVGLHMSDGSRMTPDEIRNAAERAMVDVSSSLARAGVSFVLESSVLDATHLQPLQRVGARVLAVHVVASAETIGARLRERIAAGDQTMKRLLDQHDSGVMRPEIFVPSDLAERTITLDTSNGQTVGEQSSQVTDTLSEMISGKNSPM